MEPVYTLVNDAPYFMEQISPLLSKGLAGLVLFIYWARTAIKTTQNVKANGWKWSLLMRNIFRVAVSIFLLFKAFFWIDAFSEIGRTRTEALHCLEKDTCVVSEGKAVVVSKSDSGKTGYDIVRIGNEQFKVWYRGAITVGYKGLIENETSCFSDNRCFKILSLNGHIVEIYEVRK